MVKNGFKIMDSDIHLVEPPGLWERYMETEFKERGPRIGSAEGSGPGSIVFTIDGQTVDYKDSSMVVTENSLTTGFQELPARQRQAHIRAQRLTERANEEGRAALTGREAGDGTDPKNMLAAMGVEGIDMAIVFRTFGAHVLAFDAKDGMDGALAAAHTTIGHETIVTRLPMC